MDKKNKNLKSDVFGQMLIVRVNPARRDGFTLLELVIAIGLLLIMVSMVAGFYGGVVKDIDLDAIASKIISDLRNAQNASMLGIDGNAWGVCFIHNATSDTHRYDIVSPPGTCAYDDGAENSQRAEFLPSGITFSDPSSNSAELVAFKRISGTNSIETNSVIDITAQGQTKRVTVNAEGRIIKQDL